MEATIWEALLGYFFMTVLSVSIYWSIRSLLQIKKKWWCKPILLLISWLILGMIIFIGDWGNLPATLLIFMLGIWNCCEGSRWKRLVIGFMLASTVFAFNGFWDNGLEMFLFMYMKIYENKLHEQYAVPKQELTILL